MKIVPPFGYGEIVPLQKTHRVLLPGGATPLFCRGINALALSVGEFTAAARDYPVVFATGDGGRSFAPVAVLGLRDGENLFVSPDGEWDRSAYLPAFVRRYPFCMSRVIVDGTPRGDRVACVAVDYLDAAGRTLYDAEGRPTAEWETMQRLLLEFEQDLDRTAATCAALADLGLFSPFVMRAAPEGGQSFELKGMYRVDMGRLGALDAAKLRELLNSGVLSAVFAHLHSLENFASLCRRAVQRKQQPAGERIFR